MLWGCDSDSLIIQRIQSNNSCCELEIASYNSIVSGINILFDMSGISIGV